MSPRLFAALALIAGLTAPGRAAELLLPQERSAYYSDEAIELAVVGTEAGKAAAIQLAPGAAGSTPVDLTVPGDGGTVTLVLPPLSLAPGKYTIKLDGADTGTVITVADGINNSTMLFSQTSTPAGQGGMNFLVSNAFSFGRLDGGVPTLEPRGKRSAGMNAFDNAIALDLPSVVYMYWTGYVTHKAFGSHKSWAEEHYVEATRLLNFHTAQRLRRFGKNVPMIGTLDEPGLAWGRTPAGGAASGFPGWDEQPWYEARGWEFTSDIASRDDADWMKYVTIRCAIMGEVNQFAKDDIKSIWPEPLFATDLYAPHAIMDGTDPWNQRVNEVPTSHVFMDWGVGKLGALSGLYLEKSDDPTRKQAHAMNGQLFGERVPQQIAIDSYRLMANAMLASGLYSNWWLNSLNAQDSAVVNEPPIRVGSIFQEMTLENHDVAVVWSFTECAMRQKEIAAMESKKKTGEQIALMIASAPEDSRNEEGKVVVNAYSVGQNYKDGILTAHQSISRAGYPAHIIHEKALIPGVPGRYKTLVLVGQTFDFPADVRQAIDAFVASGGKLVVDKTTTVKFDGAIVTDADYSEIGYKWGNVYGLAAKAMVKDAPLGMYKSLREASIHHTNWFMDEPARAAAPLIKAALQQTDSQPAIVTDDVHLAAEKHTGGEGAIYLVINAFDKLPDIADDQKHWIYNYAPHTATYTLQGIAPGSTVYCIEGADWKTVTKIENPDQPQNGSFAAGEMKIYIVAPKQPDGLDVKAQAKDGQLQVTATLVGVKMPWPVDVSVHDPRGNAIYSVHRATDVNGQYTESFPLGGNAAAGGYQVSVESPVGGLSKQAPFNVEAKQAEPHVVAEAARVFDGDAIKSFLAGKPAIVIAASDATRAVAEKLAADLSAKGLTVTVKAEADALRKVHYPRVWNPYADVFTVGEEKPLPEGAKVDAQIALSTAADGKVTATTADGKDVSTEWNLANSVVTIGEGGYVDFTGDRELVYQPGVKLYYNEQRQRTVLNATSKEQAVTAEFRAKWAKPWHRLTTHVGAYQLPPQLPEAFTADDHLILLGDSKTSAAAAALQGSDLLMQVADARYPGPGKALVQFAWSPFAVEKNVIFIGAADEAGLNAGAARLVELAP